MSLFVVSLAAYNIELIGLGEEREDIRHLMANHRGVPPYHLSTYLGIHDVGLSSSSGALVSCDAAVVIGGCAQTDGVHVAPACPSSDGHCLEVEGNPYK